MKEKKKWEKMSETYVWKKRIWVIFEISNIYWIQFMYTDSNDCQTFNDSHNSTTYTLSEYEYEQSTIDEETFTYRDKLESTESIEMDFRSSDIEVDIEEAKQQKIQKIETLIFQFFQQKGIVAGNPEEMWSSRNRQLQKKTHDILQNRGDCCVMKSSSSLLHRRLQKNINLSV